VVAVFEYMISCLLGLPGKEEFACVELFATAVIFSVYCYLGVWCTVSDLVYRKKSFPSKESDTKILQSNISHTK